jgi:import receptor subunit TOM20
MLTRLVHAGYAVYFDHKRRSDPEFRKALKRESRREARAAKEEAEAQGQEQKQAIKSAVDQAKEEGFPTDVEDKEAYFMNEVGQGELLCQDSMLSIGS